MMYIVQLQVKVWGSEHLAAEVRKKEVQVSYYSHQEVLFMNVGSVFCKVL